MQSWFGIGCHKILSLHILKIDCSPFFYPFVHQCYPIKLMLYKLSVAFKLSKRKPDDNLHMLHTLLFGKKTKVMFLRLFVLFLSLKGA